MVTSSSTRRMIGGIEETSASSEAQSAPRSYPTPAHERLCRVWAVWLDGNGFHTGNAGIRAGRGKKHLRVSGGSVVAWPGGHYSTPVCNYHNRYHGALGQRGRVAESPLRG